MSWSLTKQVLALRSSHPDADGVVHSRIVAWKMSCGRFLSVLVLDFVYVPVDFEHCSSSGSLRRLSSSLTEQSNSLNVPILHARMSVLSSATEGVSRTI